jgi:hypothetical protein
MAKIKNAPITLEVDYSKGWDEMQKEEQAYIENLRGIVKKLSSDDYAGELMQIQHADGYALYMVQSLNPAVLIHLAIGDAWESPMARLMHGADIKDSIDNMKKLNALFSK